MTSYGYEDKAYLFQDTALVSPNGDNSNRTSSLINIRMNSIRSRGRGRSHSRNGCRIDCPVSTFGPSASGHGAP